MEKRKKILYLHIGMKKTGTTAIQNFLFTNNEFLNKNGFTYPEQPFVFKQFGKARNAAFLSVSVPNREPLKREKTEAINDCFEFLESEMQKFDNIILSDEVLFERLGIKFEDRIHRLKQTAERNDFIIKVILYLRRQSDYAISRWKQYIKESAFSENFDDYVKEISQYSEYCYKDRVDAISEIFGKENIIVRKYEREELVKRNIIFDFMKIIGLELTEDVCFENIKKNDSLSNNLAQIKYWYNKYAGDASWEENNISKKSFQRIVETDYVYNDTLSLMSSDEELEIMRNFEKSNNELAKEYIGVEQLFSNDRGVDKQKYEFNNSQIVEDLTKATMAMFSEVIRELLKQKKSIKETNNKLQMECSKMKTKYSNLQTKYKKLEDRHNHLVYRIKHPITSEIKKIKK